MTVTLKNRPEIIVVTTGKYAPRKTWCNPEKSAEWFEGFEKKIREINLTAWIRKNITEDRERIVEILCGLELFIDKEILGEA